MKKICAVFVIICFSFACISASASSDITSIPSTLIADMDRSPTEWFSSELNRATFTVLASLELATRDSLYMYNFKGTSYVGYQSTVVVTAYPSARGYIVVFYHTDRPNELHYYETGWSEPLLAQTLIASVSNSSEANTDSMINTVVSTLIQLMQ